MRKPNNSKLSTKNWTIALQKIKNELNNNNHTTLFGLIQGNNINSLWGTFLLKNNIIYKQNNLFKWSENIDVTASLINRYRKFQSENSKKYSKNKNQEPNLFNMPTSARPTPPKGIKTRTPKVEFQVNNKPKSELGVIRRFLKWLW